MCAGKLYPLRSKNKKVLIQFNTVFSNHFVTTCVLLPKTENVQFFKHQFFFSIYNIKSFWMEYARNFLKMSRRRVIQWRCPCNLWFWLHVFSLFLLLPWRVKPWRCCQSSWSIRWCRDYVIIRQFIIISSESRGVVHGGTRGASEIIAWLLPKKKK